MPRLVRTARGVQIDFDTIIIKQQLAQAPMNVEVARRKEFIDSKEGKVRGAQKPASNLTVDSVEVVPQSCFASGDPVRVVSSQLTSSVAPTAQDFEVEASPVTGHVEEPVPVLPER